MTETREGLPRYIRAAIIASLAAGALYLASECSDSANPEAAVGIEQRDEYCAELTRGDQVDLRVAEVHDHGESTDHEEQTESAVALITHTLGNTTGDPEVPELEKLARCYFEDPMQGIASVLAGGSNNDPSRAVLVLTSPLSVPSGHGEKVASDLGFSDSVAKSAAASSKQAAAGKDILPIQPEVSTPENGSLHYVVKGDTLSAIARITGVSLTSLLSENANTITDTILPGQLIRVPAPDTKDETVPLNPNEVRRKAGQGFIDQHGETFKKIIGDKLPLDAVMAQAMRESGYGLSPLAVKANNFFGIKPGKYWEGDTFTKLTNEEVSAEYAQACVEKGECTIVEELDNGNVLISKEAIFRAYSSLEDGIEDYISKIESDYPDAYEAESPDYAFKLVDDDEPGENEWATDSAYADGVEELRRIITGDVAILGKSDTSATTTTTETPSPSTSEGPKTTLPERPEDPSDFEVPRGADDSVPLNPEFLKTLDKVSVTQEGYDKAIANIYDASAVLEDNPHFVGQAERASISFVTQHYTVSLYSKESDEAFVKHVVEAMKGQGTGIHFVVRKDGRIFKFTNSDMSTRPGHNKPYNSVSIGIEYESETQEAITKEQIEAGVYLNFFILKKFNLFDHDFATTVIGHAEARNAPKILDMGFAARGDWGPRDTRKFRALLDQARAAGIRP